MIALYDFTLSGNCYKVTDAGTSRFGVQSDSGQLERGGSREAEFQGHPFWQGSGSGG